MTNRHDVERFLADFKIKLGTHQILFRGDRAKNKETLLELEFRTPDVVRTIKELKAEDYCQGPIDDTLNNINSMWVFGKEIKSKEVYIKITQGEFNKPVICISFHFSEHPLQYPLKNR